MRPVLLTIMTCLAIRAGQTTPAELLRTGQFREALAAIQADLKSRPNDPRLLSMQGIVLAQLGNEAAALQSYRSALVASPDYLAALEGAAQIEYKNDDSEAGTHLDRLLALNPNDATAHAMRATLEFRSGQCEQSVTDFAAAAEVIEKQPDALRQFGGCLFHLGHFSDSEKVFAKLLAAHPDDLRAAYGAAASQLETGHFEAAVGTLKPFSSDPTALALSASALEKLGRIPEAVADLRSALLAEPTRESLYTQFTELCFTYKSFQAGIDVINAGLTQLPRSSRLYVLRGVLLVQQGNYELADQDFAKAETLNPNEPTSADAAILSLVQANKLDEAELALNQKLQQHPRDPQLIYFLADVLGRKGDSAGSMVAARKAVALRPDFPLAHDLLARLYLQTGDVDGAIAECKAALKTDPQDEAALYRWLRILKARHADSDATLITDLSKRWAQAKQNQKDDELRQSQFRIITSK